MARVYAVLVSGVVIFRVRRHCTKNHIKLVQRLVQVGRAPVGGCRPPDSSLPRFAPPLFLFFFFELCTTKPSSWPGWRVRCAGGAADVSLAASAAPTGAPAVPPDAAVADWAEPIPCGALGDARRGVRSMASFDTRAYDACRWAAGVVRCRIEKMLPSSTIWSAGLPLTSSASWTNREWKATRTVVSAPLTDLRRSQCSGLAPM